MKDETAFVGGVVDGVGVEYGGGYFFDVIIKAREVGPVAACEIVDGDDVGVELSECLDDM